MDGWMTCNLTSISTEFQTYQDGRHVIKKGYVQRNPITKRSPPQEGLELMTARSEGQSPVVQSIVSVTSSLRGQLVKCFTNL